MQTYASILGIKLITTAECEANLAEFIKKDDIYNRARGAQQVASDTYQATLPAVYNWLLGVSNMLAAPTRFGTRWNTRWAEAGWISHTTKIPSKIDERLALALAVSNFFAANPDYEVPNMNQTAHFGMSLRQASLDAEKALTVVTIELNDASTAWNTAYTNLTNGMRSLLRNLANVLGNGDPRWLSFGFAMPATPSTPGKPVDVTAQLDESGNVMVQFPPVPLATRYRIRRLIVGVETSYTLAGSWTEPTGFIEDVMPGQTVQIIVQAVNGRLQGVASDPIQFTIPLPEARNAAQSEPVNEAVTNGMSMREVSNGHARRTASNGAR